MVSSALAFTTFVGSLRVGTIVVTILLSPSVIWPSPPNKIRVSLASICLLNPLNLSAAAITAGSFTFASLKISSIWPTPIEVFPILTGSLSVSGSVNAQSFYQNSSRTLKTNIISFEKSAINLLDNINVVEFNYLNDLTNKHIGFIAEDTPVELSTLNQNVMDTNSTVGVLITAIQELTQKVNELETKLK